MIFDKIIKKIEEQCFTEDSKLAISGGHYIIGNGINSGTLDSFDIMLRVSQFLKKKKLSVYPTIFVNDIGQTCSSSSCSVDIKKMSKNDFTLPDEYINLLKEYNLNMSDINIIFEKHIRNRSKKIINKIRKNNQNILIKKSDGYYIRDEERGDKYVLTRSSEYDEVGTPACPLIMSAYYEYLNDNYDSNINFYYIGKDNYSNIPNYIVIEKGLRVATIFGINSNSKNVYFSDENNIKTNF